MPPIQSPNLGPLQPIRPNHKVSSVWDELKVQISPFNKIISIPATCFRDWTVEDKKTILLLMQYTTGKGDLIYTEDLTLPDRIYLGSGSHFITLPTAFKAISIEEPELKLPEIILSEQKFSDQKLPNGLAKIQERDVPYEQNMD
ncbi:hypothetical protein SLS62_010981 [Diatrype stigma]|uniref:Uncharacterized protein n=1 Tax=Diatrype stigma TaxID=117547 RepID=A0AAN9U867_9PEZI